jgi:hypothetical protein
MGVQRGHNYERIENKPTQARRTKYLNTRTKYFDLLKFICSVRGRFSFLIGF